MKHVSLAYIERANKVLVVWHKRHLGWVLPGGRVEPGEGPIAALYREVQEETGVTVKWAAPIWQGLRETAYLHVYHVSIALQQPREAEEGSPVSWFTREAHLAGAPHREFYEKLYEQFPLGYGGPET